MILLSLPGVARGGSTQAPELTLELTASLYQLAADPEIPPRISAGVAIGWSLTVLDSEWNAFFPSLDKSGINLLEFEPSLAFNATAVTKLPVVNNTGGLYPASAYFTTLCTESGPYILYASLLDPLTSGTTWGVLPQLPFTIVYAQMSIGHSRWAYEGDTSAARDAGVGSFRFIGFDKYMNRVDHMSLISWNKESLLA